MKKTIIFILKSILITFTVLFFGIWIATFVETALEKPPEHPLDFQDINETMLDKPINSIGDGLPYTLYRAHQWRQDAVLTGLEIISIGKEEIENNNGRLRYIFEFPYVDKSKPSGIMFVSIDTNLNAIDFVSASHDEEAETREIKVLQLQDLSASIRKVYEVAIKAIGEEYIFQYDQPFVRVKVTPDLATFELSPSRNEQYITTYSVEISMKTYDITNVYRDE